MEGKNTDAILREIVREKGFLSLPDRYRIVLSLHEPDQIRKIFQEKKMSPLSLPYSTPEEQGISSKAVLRFIETIEKKHLELHSFMLMRHGYIVASGWWDPYRAEEPHMLFYLSKSFTSSAVGFAVTEGLLTVDDAVISFFPEELPEKVSKNLAAMKVKHLLTMSTGHAEDTTERLRSDPTNENWVKTFLSLPVENEPGKPFVYNSGAT